MYRVYWRTTRRIPADGVAEKKGRKNSGNVANSEWLVDQLYYFLPVMHVSVSIYGAKKLVRTKEEVEEVLRSKTM